MRELIRLAGVFALGGVLAGCGATIPAPITPEQKVTADAANPDSAVLADFNARLENYVKLQRSLLDASPSPEETPDPQDIAVAQDVLAEKIRSVRNDAKQGDIFTPEVSALFRRLMYPALRGEGGEETKALIEGDAPPPLQLTVNQDYPKDQPLSTVPPNLLANLPALPDDVEYRIVGRALILRDVDANIVVDVIPNAVR